MDLPLVSAKLISDGSSASVIIYLRKGKKKPTQICCETAAGRVRLCDRNTSREIKVKEGGEGSVRTELPLQLVVRQVVTLQLMEDPMPE